MPTDDSPPGLFIGCVDYFALIICAVRGPSWARPRDKPGLGSQGGDSHEVRGQASASTGMGSEVVGGRVGLACPLLETG
jgi:hypothetical protein